MDNTQSTVRVDLHRLQILNDRINQTLEALQLLRLSSQFLHSGGQNAFSPFTRAQYAQTNHSFWGQPVSYPQVFPQIYGSPYNTFQNANIPMGYARTSGVAWSPEFDRSNVVGF